MKAVDPDSVETPSLDEVLSRISVGDGDPAVVSEYAMGLIAARSRRRRMVGGIAAIMILAAGATALTIGGTDPPEEVVTPAAETTTTQAATTGRGEVADSTEPGTAATQPAATQPPAILPTPPLSVPGASGTRAGGTGPAAIGSPGPLPTNPAQSNTITRIPPAITDLPPQGKLVVTGGPAGSALPLSFDFWDPDGPTAKPTMVMFTDEHGADGAQAAAKGVGSCTGGPGTRGALRDQVQFAGTGQRRVTVAVSYCNSAPVRYTTDVEISAPKFSAPNVAQGPGRALMAEVPDWYRDAKAASWRFIPDDGGGQIPVAPGAADITHRRAPQDGFSLLGVVVVVPAGRAGGLVLVVPAGDGNPSERTYSGRVEAAPLPDGAATHVRMMPANPKVNDLP